MSSRTKLGLLEPELSLNKNNLLNQIVIQRGILKNWHFGRIKKSIEFGRFNITFENIEKIYVYNLKMSKYLLLYIKSLCI